MTLKHIKTVLQNRVVLFIRTVFFISIILTTTINFSCSGRLILKNIDANSEDWYTPGGSFERTSQIKSINPKTTPLKLVWKKQFMSGISGQPAVVDGVVIVPFLNGDLAAFRLHNGKKIDKKRFGRGPILGFTMFNKVAYWTSNREKKSYRAYDLEKGRYVWKINLRPLESSPVIKENKLFVGCLDHLFYCLDITDGTTIWKQKVQDQIRVAPVFNSHLVFYNDYEGKVYSRRISDGKLMWKTFLSSTPPDKPENPYSHPVVSGNQLFITTLNGSVFSLDTADGKIRWHIKTGYPIYASPSSDSQSVFVPISSGEVYSIKKESGDINWIYESNTIINKEILVSDSHLLFSTYRGDILLLEKISGNLIWKYSLKNRIVLPLVFAEGYLIVSDDSNSIYVLKSSENEIEEKLQ